MKPFSVSSTNITNRESDSFNRYLKDVSNIKPFTPDEENICAEKAFIGDSKALDELVNRNLRFVISVAKQYVTKGVTLEDLVNEGNLGLVMAAKRFEPNRGFKFISYAVWWIRKNILEYINNNSRLVRLPNNVINDLSKFNKKLESLEQKIGEDIDINDVFNEIDDDLSISDMKLFAMFNNLNVLSLDKPIDSSEESCSTLYDILADTSVLNTDHLVDNNNMGEEINNFISFLKPRYIIILNKLFGLNNEPELTLNEIGDELGISSEMVRQIRDRALKKLKDKATRNPSII